MFSCVGGRTQTIDQTTIFKNFIKHSLKKNMIEVYKYNEFIIDTDRRLFDKKSCLYHG